MQKKETTKALVLAAMQGDKTAYAELYAQKAKNVYYIALKYVKNPQDAEDIAQEVLLSVLQNIGALKSPEYFDTWLYRLVINKCNEMHRIFNTKKRRVTMAAPLEEYENLPEDRLFFLPEEYAEDAEKRSTVLEAVESLPTQRRIMVVLYYYEGLSYKEIAEVLGVPMGTVTSGLSRAKETLLRKLEGKYGPVHAGVNGFAGISVLSRILAADVAEQYTMRIFAHAATPLVGAATAAQANTGLQAIFPAAIKIAATATALVAAIILPNALLNQPPHMAGEAQSVLEYTSPAEPPMGSTPFPTPEGEEPAQSATSLPTLPAALVLVSPTRGGTTAAVQAGTGLCTLHGGVELGALPLAPENLTVTLVANGSIVATTGVSAGGTYAFPLFNFTAGNTYYLMLESSETTPLALLLNESSGVVPVAEIETDADALEIDLLILPIYS